MRWYLYNLDHCTSVKWYLCYLDHSTGVVIPTNYTVKWYLYNLDHSTGEVIPVQIRITVHCLVIPIQFTSLYSCDTCTNLDHCTGEVIPIIYITVQLWWYAYTIYFLPAAVVIPVQFGSLYALWPDPFYLYSFGSLYLPHTQVRWYLYNLDHCTDEMIPIQFTSLYRWGDTCII